MLCTSLFFFWLWESRPFPSHFYTQNPLMGTCQGHYASLSWHRSNHSWLGCLPPHFGGRQCISSCTLNAAGFFWAASSVVPSALQSPMKSVTCSPPQSSFLWTPSLSLLCRGKDLTAVIGSSDGGLWLLPLLLHTPSCILFFIGVRHSACLATQHEHLHDLL